MVSEGPPRRAILARMNPFFDSFWRAVAYCLHPRVIALSFLPLIIMVALALGLGYFFWEPAIDSVRVWLESSTPAIPRLFPLRNTPMFSRNLRAWAG